MGGEILESRVCFKDVGPVTINQKIFHLIGNNYIKQLLLIGGLPIKYPMSPKLTDIFVKVASMNSFHSHYLNRDILNFSNHVGNVSIVIDIGGGNSPYKDIFRCKQYISLDIEKRDAKLNVLGDICHLPIKNNSVDMIVCTEVIEHVSETLRALRELKRVVKPEGYIIITTPFIIGQHETVDFYRFTSMGLEKLFEDVDLKIIEINKRGGIFSCMGSVLTHIPQTLINKDKANPITYGFVFFYLLLLVPISKILLVLDNFDRKKDYTLGFNVLLKKAKSDLKTR